ncbi:MAG: ribonuclease E/G [Acetobacteraceae bacterium]
MTTEIRASASPGEVRVALLRDGDLTDYALWRPGAPDGVADEHRGRVLRHVKAMAGAFVAIAGAEGFLPDSEGAKGLTEGRYVTVRVTRAAQGGKGPRLSARLPADAETGGDAVGLLRRGPDPVCRFAAAHPDAPVLVDDQALAATLRVALGGRVRVVPDILDETLATKIEALGEPVADLPGGARMSVWPTPALTAIDVDAGGAVTGHGGRGSRHEGINRDILPALAREIRLRNLSGAIVIDLAGLPIRRRAALGPALADALSDDPLHPRFLGFTALGLAEVLRTRIHPPLHELLRGPHAAGLAALRAVTANLGTDPRRMPVLRASDAVVNALQADPVALADLARRAGKPLILRRDPGLKEGEWHMEAQHG